MKFIFRADADQNIGTGHLMRCLSLAETIKRRGHGILFFCRCESKILQTKIIDLGFEFISIDQFNFENGSDPFLRHLNGSDTIGNRTADEWVVLDGYHFDSAYQMAIRKAGFKLLVIDDYCHLPEYSCDVLLNHNIYAPNIQYPVNHAQTLLLLGAKYALIRPEFIEARESRKEFVKEFQNILITLGGADPKNVTRKIIEIIETTRVSPKGIRVVLGPANPHFHGICDIIQTSLPGAEIFQSVEDMSHLMDWADIAITAGGITCLELCCVGVPFIIVIMSENQEFMAKSLERAGAAINIGWCHHIEKRTFVRVLDMLIIDKNKRHILSEAGRKIVDGRGTDRVVEKILPSSLTVRPVEMADGELLLSWANDPLVRNAAFSSDPICLAIHKKWFAEKINDPNCYHFIGIDDHGKEVGQIRFDVNGYRAEVDVSLDSGRRFMGLGPKIIEAGIEAIKKETQISQIYARVKIENITSIKAFQKAGFQDCGRTSAFGCECRMLAYSDL